MVTALLRLFYVMEYQQRSHVKWVGWGYLIDVAFRACSQPISK
jgi:hypothetical protein